MALLNIRGDWYLYFWLFYQKIYSAVIWLIGNHCRGDKGRSVISNSLVGQSLGGLHKVRTRRRKTQPHKPKHFVAVVRRPSLRRIVMAPGASTVHSMMEDKEKVLSNGEFIHLIFTHVRKYVNAVRKIVPCNTFYGSAILIFSNKANKIANNKFFSSFSCLLH